jgi:uncharacterized membrane protein YgdD (TMEM256/DUF423 family)
MKTTDKLNVTSILERVKSQTPRFWKIIRRYMVACGALGVGLMAAKTQYEMLWLSEKVCEYLVVIGVAGTTLASLTAEEDKKES